MVPRGQKGPNLTIKTTQITAHSTRKKKCECRRVRDKGISNGTGSACVTNLQRAMLAHREVL